MAIGFLEMIVSIFRSIKQDSFYHEELLHFGCKSITNLLLKFPGVPPQPALLDKLFQLFLTLKSLRIRTFLSQGLLLALSGKMNQDVLETVANLTKLKRGAADLELDYD
jgi:hypothetical protein